MFKRGMKLILEVMLLRIGSKAFDVQEMLMSADAHFDEILR